MNAHLNQSVRFSKGQPPYLFLRGAVDIAIVYFGYSWAILAGSMAIHAGLSF